MLATKLKPVLKKTWFHIFPLGKSDGNRTPLSKLLAQMDAYDWDSVEDMPVNEDERRGKLRHFNEIIGASGMELDGSLLDLASGTTSLAYLYPDAVAVDNDPRKVKMLRRDGITVVIADVESLPFENKSFDYVVSFSPPQKPIILHSNSSGSRYFTIDQGYNEQFVDAALRIARRRVLIDSYCIALEPPYNYLLEKRDTNHHHYVLYRTSNESV